MYVFFYFLLLESGVTYYCFGMHAVTVMNSAYVPGNYAVGIRRTTTVLVARFFTLYVALVIKYLKPAASSTFCCTQQQRANRFLLVLYFYFFIYDFKLVPTNGTKEKNTPNDGTQPYILEREPHMTLCPRAPGIAECPGP